MKCMWHMGDIYGNWFWSHKLCVYIFEVVYFPCLTNLSGLKNYGMQDYKMLVNKLAGFSVLK